MPLPKNDNIQAFATATEFALWLHENHESQNELWLKIFKKASGVPSITWDEAVLECLCWGWIDGVKKSLDDSAYMQRVTPRRPKSIWSKRNCEHVERLIAEHKMQESGLRHVRAAQADGRWDAAYAPSSEMVIPDDFLEALEQNVKAKACFSTLNKSSKYTISYGLETAKKAETRQKRFDKFLHMLEKNEKPR
ncbi:YdeI/OmpD-associated family protein [Paraglaciecola hydrolytica]|uniref:Bacteriocin-protection protein n=1 Tax=Paraglaciecola hydrolytica TaxID=1799789 RepID=A0A136A139_9ALTE|nr:YdeI/OmpD-associated family protein [Paraglaciecola hydrolytica]KXI28956.1 hypothetical protein AX660_12305 [Paraglaciecola hydrolytica]